MSDAVEKVDYPITASRGGDNAYVLPYCVGVSRRPHYAVCLRQLDQHFNGDSRKLQCERHIAGPNCAAIGMNQEEREAGKALYYVPRARLHAERDARDVDANARFTPGQVSSRKRAPQVEKPIAKPEELGAGQSFSQIVADTLSKAAAAVPAPQPAPVVAAAKVEVPQQQEIAFVPKPGMSMLEIAKAKAAAKKALV